MREPHEINALAEKLLKLLPPGLTSIPKDLEKNFRSILTAAFSKMDLVTREEFEAQSKVLMRTRMKLEQLEQQLQALEEKNK